MGFGHLFSLTLGFTLILTFSTTLCIPLSLETRKGGEEARAPNETEEALPVTRFREYLRFKTVHPDPDYNSSIAWIKNQAEEIGLEYSLVELKPPAQFVIVLTWRGSNQTLKSVLFNSHIDVVPVEENKWSHDPFAAEKDENGDIFARGAQDVKCVGVQYLEAVRNLKNAGVTPLRNVFIIFSPDEEVGGTKGIKAYVTTPEFKRLNVGFSLDEGRASHGSDYELMWAERVVWQVEFTAQGQAGHGSILHNNTAVEKIQKVMNRMLEARQAEKDRMESNNLALGDVTTINLTMMKGGTQVNVVPSEVSMAFDIRISPSMPLSQVQNLLDNVTATAGPGVSYSFMAYSDVVAQTDLTPDNVWWTAVQEFANEAQVEIKPTIMPGATDGRHLREIGIPNFGFSPIVNTLPRAHDHDEYLNEKVFLRGIELYEKLLPKFFNLPSDASP